MKTTITGILIMAGLCAGSYSRIESMGKTDNYMEDDMNVFVNPANMLLHKSYIFGELGTSVADSAVTIDPYAIVETPYNPWFGGIFSRDLPNGSRLAVGLAFNREDKWLSLLNSVVDRLNSDSVYTNSLINLPKPINKMDLLVGFRHSSRLAVGAHVYFAGARDNRQYAGSGGGEEPFSKRQVILLKWIAGVNKHFANNTFLESSIGTSLMNFTFYDTAKTVSALPRRGFNLFNRTRLFIPLSDRFSLVPVVNFEKVVQGAEITAHLDPDTVVSALTDNGYTDFSAGAGINFWEAEKKTEFTLGMDFHVLRSHDEVEAGWFDTTLYGGSMTGSLYSVINFGIERQLWWDWLLIRAGGRKVVGFKQEVDNYGTGGNGGKKVVASDDKLWENPPNNGTRSDLIGVGLGVFFLRKLQLDFTLSEDLPYRFLYLFSGQGGNLFTRFSCAYYF